jgi:hypothetical protein
VDELHTEDLMKAKKELSDDSKSGETAKETKAKRRKARDAAKSQEG